MNLFIVLLQNIQAFLDISSRNAEYITEKMLLSAADKGHLEEHAKTSNVLAMDGAVKLRGEDGSASFISFNRENLIDNWSTVIKVKKPILKETQQASIQLWYTDAPLGEGRFMGASGKFTGFLAGLEFTAKYSSTIFTFNYGFDFTDKEKNVLQMDRLDQYIFDGVDEIALKIVHTKNNFIIELYDGTTLVSDSFRIHQPLLAVEKGMPRYFGLTTTYKNCPNDISLDMTELKILERSEEQGYDAYETHISINGSAPTKSSQEVAHSIANLNHFITYSEIAMGKDGTSFLDVRTDLKEAVRDQRHKLDEMIAHARERNKAGNSTVQKDNEDRIDTFNLQLNEMYERLLNYRSVLLKVGEERPYRLRDGINIAFIFVIISVMVVLTGQVVKKYSSTNSIEKTK